MLYASYIIYLPNNAKHLHMYGTKWKWEICRAVARHSKKNIKRAAIRDMLEKKIGFFFISNATTHILCFFLYFHLYVEKMDLTSSDFPYASHLTVSQ